MLFISLLLINPYIPGKIYRYTVIFARFFFLMLSVSPVLECLFPSSNVHEPPHPGVAWDDPVSCFCQTCSLGEGLNQQSPWKEGGKEEETEEMKGERKVEGGKGKGKGERGRDMQEGKGGKGREVGRREEKEGGKERKAGGRREEARGRREEVRE